MKVLANDPPRTFTVGKHGIQLTDCAHIALEPDEQVTFTTLSGTEYDVVRKEWGYYATPSLNSRLPRHGLRAILVMSRETEHYFVHLVESGKDREFEQYLERENLLVVCWLDAKTLEAIKQAASR